MRPAHVDRFTGYRYYSADQLPRLNRILALKELGLSLEQIGRLLEDGLPPADLRGMLRLRQAEQRQHVREEQERLGRIDALLRQIEGENAMPDYDVIVKSIPAQTVASIRAVVPSPDLVGRLFAELEGHLAQQQARFAGFPLSLWHEQSAGWDVEAAIPVSGGTPGGDPVIVHELPALAQAACAVYRGPYEQISQAYQALAGWIEANGYRIAGPGREVYLRYGPTGVAIEYPDGCLTLNPAEYVTEIQFPVDRS